MLAHGNGGPAVCVNNLLRMVRGEGPFDRIKGLDPRLIDRPLYAVIHDIEVDAVEMIGIYEPRVQLDGVEVSEGDTPGGGLQISAIIKETEGGI